MLLALLNRVVKMENVKNSYTLYSRAAFCAKIENNMPNIANSLEQPPKQPDEDECCGEGCLDCVWLNHLVNVKAYYKNDLEKVRQTINLIPNSDVRNFVKFELQRLESTTDCEVNDKTNSKI